MSLTQPQPPANNTNTTAAPEKYLIAFVIQGDDVFKITADNIIHTTGTACGPAFDAIAKLKAAAALLELTNLHKERPTELRQMARELAGEGMKLMARASSSIRPVPPPAPVEAAAEAVKAPIEDPAEAAVAATPTLVQNELPVTAPMPPPLQQQPAPSRPRFMDEAPSRPARIAPPILPLGPAPVPKPDQRSSEEAGLPANSKIALITT